METGYTCFLCLDQSSSSGSPNKCSLELLELSLSAWCSNHTRSNTENSQCITTRLRLDTTKRTSRSLICLDLRETLRSSSSPSIKNSNKLRTLNGSESQTLFKSSKSNNPTRRERQTRNKTKRLTKLLHFKLSKAKMLKIHWSLSDTLPSRTKTWRTESLSSQQDWDIHRIELSLNQHRLRNNLWDDHQSLEVQWVVSVIKILSCKLALDKVKLSHQDMENYDPQLETNTTSSLPSTVKDGNEKGSSQVYTQ